MAEIKYTYDIFLSGTNQRFRVYKDDEIVEHISCLNGGYDEDGDVDDSYTNPHELIDELKNKWGLKELKEIKGPDWR